jgi:hypothetical protein
LVGVGAGLRDVLRDAGDVGLGVRDRLLPVRAARSHLRQLGGEVGLRVRRLGEHLGVHLEVPRRGSEPGGDLGTAGSPQRVHEEQPVLRGGVALGEHRPLTGPADDVRDAEAIAGDLDVVAAAGRVAPLDVLLRHADRRDLEVVVELFIAESRRRVVVDEVAVDLELVREVRR